MRAVIACILLVFGSLIALADAADDRETGDYNFDGHVDYRLRSKEPGNQCGWWQYFLYDPDIGDHRPVETAFCKEEFDSGRKLVLTRVNGGMAGLIYAVRHFRWDGFEPVITYSEKQDFDPARNLFIRTRVTNVHSLSGPSISSQVLSPGEVGLDKGASGQTGIR